MIWVRSPYNQMYQCEDPEVASGLVVEYGYTYAEYYEPVAEPLPATNSGTDVPQKGSK